MTAAEPTSGRELSRERIAAVALDLLDREGLDSLSMRRLANELGIGTMTLYGYFRDKEELLDAVVDAASSEAADLTLEGDWRAQLRTLMTTLRATLVRHPALVALRARRPVLNPGALRLTEASVRALRQAGFEADDAAQAYRALFSYTFGFSSNAPPGTEAEQRGRSAAALLALSPEDYPTLIEAAPELNEAMAGTRAFEYGLDLLLDGLEARLRTRA